ncbi:DUF2523 family protein [Pseudoalteromonas sp. TB64]|uniref:DUF2523 family protein n=1 Tax=Pseudoalteromonas sp. TB64 TaxID=1938600 RepID=UPI000422AC75|nr:DUF2523 family protein [Pseudoalteromonas sp. TB64]
MIKKTLFLILIFAPFVVFGADEPVEVGQGIQAAATTASNFIEDIWDFFDNDIPSFFQRAVAYILEKVVLFKINAQIEAAKLSWSVAKTILESFEVGSQIANAATALPQDVQAALVDMRLFDGLNIIIQAFVARYVMRFF